ncbi:GNAT family N-acetyltransferase [Paenibacillus selenitireducens]|uniref:GNAT family N-acetyltransferase n=1 Tax=Paenibacillus selenitireducens TaxID=1324314 RepID=A0A1T2X1N9_9BACL|nr:GNAT family N-acetyltransferase [Paenibacillus selenitireducens]OPA73757.1 GNAT family N-acetyltransferase [Paenibacillus selenitireducens]
MYSIVLEKADESDANTIYAMQVKTFAPLLAKYQDFDTNPACESIERVIARINHPYGSFYKILTHDQILVGAIRVYWDETETRFGISPMFISPSYQGQGIAQRAIEFVESMYPRAKTWELATLLEEVRNCYLYEKMGYRKTGEWKRLNEYATLVFYKKVAKGRY